MVVGAFPAFKLGALLLKQISKPIADVMKTQAKSSPVFRKYVCMPPAQFYNWCEIKAKMWILNLGKPVNIPVLNEAMAIELGANILGEGIIFTFAAVAVFMEYNRSVRKEAAKEAQAKEELSKMQNAIRELFIQSEQQGAQLREIMRQLGELDSQVGRSKIQPRPRKPTEPPPSEESPASKPPLEGSPEGKPLSDELPESNRPSGGPPAGAPPSGPSPILSNYNLVQLTVRHSDQTPYNRNNPHLHNYSLVLRAVDDVEDQFWNSPLVERQNSIVILALYHVNKLLRFQQ